MTNRRKHYFNETTVITGLLPNGEFGAYREDEDECRVRGYGHSRFAAIADLVEQVNAPDDEIVMEADVMIEQRRAA
jgi:hypothetical protein